MCEYQSIYLSFDFLNLGAHGTYSDERIKVTWESQTRHGRLVVTGRWGKGRLSQHWSVAWRWRSEVFLVKQCTQHSVFYDISISIMKYPLSFKEPLVEPLSSKKSFAHKNNKCGLCRFQSPRPYISLFRLIVYTSFSCHRITIHIIIGLTIPSSNLPNFLSILSKQRFQMQ